MQVHQLLDLENLGFAYKRDDRFFVFIVRQSSVDQRFSESRERGDLQAAQVLHGDSIFWLPRRSIVVSALVLVLLMS